MFKKILVPTDFSEYAHETVECVSELAGAGEVILLHVMDTRNVSTRVWIGGQEFGPPLDHAREFLRKEENYLEENGVLTRTVILEVQDGNVPREIISYAEKEDVGLIMMGAMGKGIIEGMLLGSVSSRVLNEARTHVMIFHHPPPGTGDRSAERPDEKNSGSVFRRILIPIDFSRQSTQGTEFIHQINGVEQLILLHVISGAVNREDLETRMKDSYIQLQNLGRRLDFVSSPVQLHIRFGKPAEEICSTAKEENATLIMISRFGESDYTDNALIGGTAAEVARNAEIPVFIRYPDIVPEVSVREMEKAEFWLAEEVWERYKGQKADTLRDRIFGVFVKDTPVCVARCHRHTDGLEVDGVFTYDEFRGRGYATQVMDALVEACGSETLYMYSPSGLVEFYKLYDFIPVKEEILPGKIKEESLISMDEVERRNLRPMKREPIKNVK